MRGHHRLAVIALAVGALATVAAGGCGRTAAPAPPASPSAYAPELQRLLDARLALVREVAGDVAVREAVALANQASASLTEKQIAQRDAQWQATHTNDAFGAALQSNAAALHLAAFRARHPGFTEIFATDRRGLVAAMTNRTSDYLQADEGWWQRAYADGRGRAFVGAIEYDASSQSQAIALCVPIRDVPSSQVVGVIKALYDVDAIKAEL